MPGTTDAQPNWRRKLPHRPARPGPPTNRCAALPDAGARSARARRPRHRSPRRPGTLVPRATYRLQFHKDFDFDDAIAHPALPGAAGREPRLLLADPARAPGQHARLRRGRARRDQPRAGRQPGFERFSAALKSHGMGQLLDMVPNHMGVLGADNAWWMDVLENGPASLYAQHFDIDWQPLNAELTGKVLLPVLGDHYGDVLERGELVLDFDAEHGAASRCATTSTAFRWRPRAIRRAASAPKPRAGGPRPRGRPRRASPPPSATCRTARRRPSREAVAERARDKELLKARLARLVGARSRRRAGHRRGGGRTQPADARDDAARADRGAGLPPGLLARGGRRDQLPALLRHQRAGRPAHGARGGVRGHAGASRSTWPASGAVDGLRIDHPDGLYDPAGYFDRLQDRLRAPRRPGAAGTDGPTAGRARPLYVVAEKIAAPHEEVPETWAVHGTTGYRFANRGQRRAGRHRARPSGFDASGAPSPASRKLRGAAPIRASATSCADALSSELNVLSTELLRIARADRRTRDYTLNTLRRALSEVAACMPVYRTYIIDAPSEQDVRYVDLAIEPRRRRSRAADPSVFAFVRQTLLGRPVEDAPAEQRARVRRFATRFQQFSAPVAAKGVEDTAFYRYFPLSSLNEVGGEPAIFGMTVAEFHRASADRAQRWPHTMLATSTHDNKRSEDVRNSHRRAVRDAGGAGGSRCDAGAAQQGPARGARRGRRGTSALGRARIPALPDPAGHARASGRLCGDLPRATRIASCATCRRRRAKPRRTPAGPSRARPTRGAGALRARGARAGGTNPFLADLHPFAANLRWFGALNSFSLVLLKYGSPGVPDLYQGNELMDVSLVDPDNRRPVDYTRRAGMLEQFASRARRATPDTTGERLARWAVEPATARPNFGSAGGCCHCAGKCRRCFAMRAIPH